MHKIVKVENIKLRRSYIKEIKQHRINLIYFRHQKRLKAKFYERLRTIAKTILRDIDRKFYNLELHNKYATKFYFIKYFYKRKYKGINFLFTWNRCICSK